MYLAFHKVVKRGVDINPQKYHVVGTPPIDKITQNWREIRADEVE